MSRRSKLWAVGAAAAIAIATGSSIAASGGGHDSETPISGAALEQASAAALDHTGGGKVTDTEVGDEESMYEVEVTLDNGSQVDVQLDRDFKVVGQEADDDSSEKDDDD